jgi:hypothetical protein
LKETIKEKKLNQIGKILKQQHKKNTPKKNEELKKAATVVEGRKLPKV